MDAKPKKAAKKVVKKVAPAKKAVLKNKIEKAVNSKLKKPSDEAVVAIINDIRKLYGLKKENAVFINFPIDGTDGFRVISHRVSDQDFVKHIGALVEETVDRFGHTIATVMIMKMLAAYEQ